MNHVEYVVVGGYAVAYHGFPRATVDIDIWIATTPENATRVLAALDQFGFGVTGGSLDLLTHPNRVIRMGIPPLRIEIQTTISGVRFEDCYTRRVDADLDGIPVPIISADDLRINKRAAGRLKDLVDLENLP